MKICINAGYCMELDRGSTGLREADVTKSIAKKVTAYLRVAGHNVLFVQENDLDDIIAASNFFNSNLFVAIHCNKATSKVAKGGKIFCFSEMSASGKLARNIQKQIINSLGTIDRGIKSANFEVLRDTHCPAVLVETTFISNEDDEKLLASEQGKEDFAKAITWGITDYIAGI